MPQQRGSLAGRSSVRWRVFVLRVHGERPSCRRAAEKGDELSPFHSISLVNAGQSFCDDVSHRRVARPAQLQDASNRQANDDESADEQTGRGQSAFAGTGFAHSGTELSRRSLGSLLHLLQLYASPLRTPAAGSVKPHKAPPPFESHFWSLRFRREVVLLLYIPCCVLIASGLIALGCCR